MRLLDIALLKFAADSPFMIRPLDSGQMGMFGGIAGGALGAGLGTLGGAGLGAALGSPGNRKRNALKGALMGLVGGGALGAYTGHSIAGGAAETAHLERLAAMVGEDQATNGAKMTGRYYLRDLFQKARRYGPTTGHSLTEVQSAEMDAHKPGLLWGGTGEDGAARLAEARKVQMSQALNRHVQFPLKDLSKVMNDPNDFLQPRVAGALNEVLADGNEEWATKRMAQGLADSYSRHVEDSD